MQITPRDSPRTLQLLAATFFLTPKVVGGRPSLPLKFVPKVTHPPSNTTISTNIRSQRLNRDSWRKEKLQLAPTGSRPRAFLRAIDEPCALTLSPPMGGTKRDFAIFSNKIQLLSKKSATKFLCVKTPSGKVVATSFLYLMVHRRIVGDIPIYQKFALKVTHCHTCFRGRVVNALGRHVQ